MYIKKDYERIVLKSVLTYPDLFDNIDVNIFGIEDHRCIYRAMQECADNKVDINSDNVISLMNAGAYSSMLEVDTTEPVMEIGNYVHILKDEAVKRSLHEILSNGTKSLETLNGYELMNRINSELDIARKSLEFETDYDFFGIKKFDEVEDDNLRVLCSRFVPFTENTVSILAGAGGTGKSLLMIQIALHYVLETGNKACLWLSEDNGATNRERMNKILANCFGYLTDDETKRVASKMYLMEQTPFNIIQKGRDGIHVNTMWTKFKQTMKDFGFIVLDPLISFMTGLDENSNTDAKAVMKEIVDFATKDKKSIFVIHHASKGSVNARGAGAIKDAVRLVYGLNFDKDSKDKRVISFEKDNNNVASCMNNNVFKVKVI
jgi:replicative DNA helicase